MRADDRINDSGVAMNTAVDGGMLMSMLMCMLMLILIPMLMLMLIRM